MKSSKISPQRQQEVISITVLSGSGNQPSFFALLNSSGGEISSWRQCPWKRRPHYSIKTRYGFPIFLNLFENLMFWKMLSWLKQLLPDKRDRKEAESIAKANLEKVGMGTILKSQTKQLSGGQKQRVAIARALLLTRSHPL